MPNPPDKKEPQKVGTALMQSAQSFDEHARAFAIANRVRQQEMLAEAAARLAETSWGTKLSPIARAGVARYAMETGTDPVRHWFVLGGQLYDRAELYFDLVAAMPDFERDDVDFIHDDPELPADERARRRVARERWGAPHEAKGVAVVTLYFRGRGPFVGVNWAGRGRKTKDGGMQDPVGEQEPTKTAHTRAFRKAAKKAVPLWFLRHPWAEKAQQQIAMSRELARAADAALEGSGGRGEAWNARLAEMHEGVELEPLPPGSPALDDPAADE